jgi:hypothetical protein
VRQLLWKSRVSEEDNLPEESEESSEREIPATGYETFGVTLPVRAWKALFNLADHEDRQPSDYLRVLLQREHERVFGDRSAQHASTPSSETERE